jgi:glycolate oxidase FAD binding subunit
MVVEKIRSEVKNGFDVWGYEATALEIMRRIKQEFDPRDLLNPGRFVGGI